MKTRNSVALIALFAVILLALTGCKLARADAGDDYYEDRLIGVFVTTEYLDLFDAERYMNDNLQGFSGGEIRIDSDAKEYQGRIYADPASNYTFENITGIRYFSPILEDEFGSYTSSIADDGISDSHLSVHTGDNEESRALTGKLYAVTGSSNVYYLNPVYQTEDGRIYLTAGGGITASGVHDEGPMMSQTLNATYTFTENGVSATDSFSVTLSVEVMFPPQRISIMQMNADGELLSRSDFAPNEMPDVIETDANAAFLVVETHKTDRDGMPKVARDIYSGDSANIETYSAGTDGICVKKHTQIEWPQ